MTQVRAAVYTRISLDKGQEGLGVARQREAAEKLCAARGWQIVDVLDENDTSATSRKARPRYQRLLRMIDGKEIDVVVVWAVDRLVRRLADLEDVIERCERAGVKLATVSGDIDLSTDAGRLVARILASVARGEIERKSTRMESANRQRAQMGKVSTGGIRTLGFTPGMVKIVPAEAKQIRRGFATMISGASLRGIAREWNETAAFRTAHGGEWTPFGVRTVLRNQRYAGRSIHQGTVVGRGRWSPLVSEDVFDAVQAILDDPARKTTPSTARRYLLPGIARCECGADVRTGRTQHGRRTYYCAESKHLSRAAAPVDAWIIELTIERLAQPDAAALTVDRRRPGLAELRTESLALHTRLDQLADMFATGEMTREQFKRATERVRERLAAVTTEMADATVLDALGPFLASAADADGIDARRERITAQWDRADLDVQRAVITTLFEAIVLHPPGRGTRVFDPATITIVWRTR
jgi:site-specific DNA recombinase